MHPHSTSAKVTYAIVIVSDRGYRDNTYDKATELIKSILKDDDRYVLHSNCIIPDDEQMILSKFRQLTVARPISVSNVSSMCQDSPSLVIFSGGTGIATTDKTHILIPHLRILTSMQIAIVVDALSKTPNAMLGNPIAGICNSTIVIALPGSLNAVKDGMMVVKNVLPHAAALLASGATHGNLDHFSSRIVEDSSATTVSDKLKTQIEADRSHGCACHSGESASPAIPFIEALKIVASFAFPKINPISLESSCILNKNIADDVYSPIDIPAHDCTFVDGFAVNNLESQNSSEQSFKILSDTIHACTSDSYSIPSNTAIRINTGARIPENCKIVKIEDCVVEENYVKIKGPLKSGMYVRKAASDVSKGQLIISESTKINAHAVGILASIGIQQVKVYCPKVAVFSTGDELFNSIFDANRPALKSLLTHFPIIDLGIIKDDLEELKSTIQKALSQSDIIISTGGVSQGTKDFIKQAIIELGGKIAFGRVFMKPGLPTTFATFGKNQLYFGLAGNPVSAITAFHVLVKPVLDICCNLHKEVKSELMSLFEVVQVQMAFSLISDEREEFVRVKLERQNNQYIAYSRGNQQSSRLMSYLDANGLLWLPPHLANSEVSIGSIQKAILLHQ